ncbi:MAG: tRNA (adenosine(37)-N6)-dimethylallyltransferase MiaA [Candidatus Omnitrophica bacterium]|nr:tRNA (adenosine(37)-N6)-dimethylallyltransferase MiaA [Candidatus Omnitrophota bacterium]
MISPLIAKKKIIFILGPTAIGKSEIAFHLAKRLKGEVISCDSMQVYKGMSIITSKPPGVFMQKVKHHLVGMLALNNTYDASSFRRDALKKIDEIVHKGKVPIVAGGSGLYASILINGIFDDGDKDTVIRNKLYKIADNKGCLYLHKRLKRVDPRAADKIHPNDLKRVVRALEVFKVTGKPISLLQKGRRGLRGEYDINIFCLNMPREELYKRIDRRVDKMFRMGLVNEVRALLKKRLSRTAFFAIGIKEINGYLKGFYSKEEAKEMIKMNTRRYAKRQLSWFRKDRDAVWINLKGKDTALAVSRNIWKKLY